jgi:putative transposase
LRDNFGEEASHPGHHSIRLRGYDYTSSGLYFLTICPHEKRCIFGQIIDGQAVLSRAGVIVRECWIGIPEHFSQARLHEFVIMPNHLHGIVEVCGKLGRSGAASLRGRNPTSVAPGSLGAIVRSFKGAATKRVHEDLEWSGEVWQRNYFERVVRDGEEFSAATRYVLENPERWEWDRENPGRKPVDALRAPFL